MKIALPIWDDHISPVFDTAAHILLVEGKSIQFSKKENISVESLSLFQRIDLLKKLDLDIFICGGITHATLENIRSQNIKTIPFICGNVDQILDAVLKGKNIKSLFSMPGDINKELG